MQGRGRRLLLIAAGAIAVWFFVVLFGWAIRPQHDSIPVGVDYDAAPQRLISQKITCNTLFSGSAHDGPLPTLRILHNTLAFGFQQLKYQRDGCTLVQRDARIVFGLDTVGAIIGVGGLVYFAIRKEREPAGSHRDPEPSYA